MTESRTHLGLSETVVSMASLRGWGVTESRTHLGLAAALEEAHVRVEVVQHAHRFHELPARRNPVSQR